MALLYIKKYFLSHSLLRIIFVSREEKERKKIGKTIAIIILFFLKVHH